MPRCSLSSPGSGTAAGFVYDEQPPAADGPPLVSFATRTRAGYCQHYAGAMAVMLRLLGIPARVAVGFTSGTRKDDKWVVTDHEAHAWVEVWFAGQGWVPFDPTPGRGTFGGTYSFASDSKDAVDALRRGDLSGVTPFVDRERPDLADRARVGGRRRARTVDLRVRFRIGRPLGARGRARQGDLPPRPLPDP